MSLSFWRAFWGVVEEGVGCDEDEVGEEVLRRSSLMVFQFLQAGH